MASRVPEDPSNNTAETDEETVALRKKRSRRVSFADREITSVHIFKRDEDYETPPNSSASKQPSSDNVTAAELENEVLGFFRDLGDSDDSRDLLSSPNGEDEGKDVVVGRKYFLRPAESPFSGSSALGSAASYDEENFFGPVSTNFIRPGRLSDSAISDENHDITMDSTAFSMHFRSLARSESEDFKNPTGVNIAFEEKSPSLVESPSKLGSSMMLTKAKKLFPRSLLPVDKVSERRDSNDMSLVGENPHKYDYGRLSPTLEALLSEVGPDLHPMPASYCGNLLSLKSDASTFDKDGSSDSDTNDQGDTKVPGSSDSDTNDQGDTKVPGSSDRDPNDHGDGKTHSIGSNNMLADGAPRQQIELSLSNNLTSTLANQITHDCELKINDTPAAGASVNCEIQSQKQFGKFQEKGSVKVMAGIDVANVEPSMVNGTPLNMSGEKHQVLFATKSRQEYPTEDWMKEKSSMDRSQTSDFDHISDQHYRSPLANSSFSLNVTRPQISLDMYLTPSLKQSINQGENLSSIQKSKSKSKIQGTPFSSSALRSRIEKSKLALSEYNLSTTSPSNIVIEEISKDLQHKHVDAPITNLGTQLSSACIPQCKPIQLNAMMASPSQLMWSGKKVAEHLLETENFAEGRFISNSLLGEGTFDGGKHKNESSSHEKFPTSLVKRLNQKSLSSINNSDLEQQDQYHKLLGFSPMKNAKPFDIVPNNYSTTLTDKLDSLLRGVQSSSPPTKSNHLENFTQVKKLGNRESHLSDLQNVPDNIQSFQAPSRDKDNLKLQLESPGKNLQISTHATSSVEELPAERMKASSSISPPSPYMHQSIKETSLCKSPSKYDSLTWQIPTPDTSKKEQNNRSLGEDMQLAFGKYAASFNPNSNGYVNVEGHEELRMSQSHFSEQDVENCSRQKRKGEEIISGDAGNSDKIRRASRSPMIRKRTISDSELMLEHSIGSNQRDESIGGGTALMNWTYISQKFSTETHKLLSPLADKLQTRAIGMLEDSLAHLKKVHRYETLCSKITAQNIYDISSNVMLKRQAEIRLLLSDLAYEKAKLQLMYLKHERLLKKIQPLSSVIEESEFLRLNFKHLSIPTKRDTTVDDSLNPPCSADSEGKHEVASEIVTKMKEECEALDRKVKNAAKPFHTYCKMKGEPSCADTILFLNDHLKKRMCCRFIRQDMQLWEVDDLESGNGHHTVVLNYCGFICQRLTIKSEPVSNFLISNRLIDTIITKSFPNMDVCTAFAFVFNAKSTKKYTGSKSLAQETQTTSLLLRNLVDVVEEVQLAQVEIQNLMQASFNSSSAEQLNLQLSFVDLDSSKRVMIILDMTCLNCGIYPSEALPSKLQDPISWTEDLQIQSLYSKIKTACGSLRGGYSRIIRLCRCVSQVLQ